MKKEDSITSTDQLYLLYGLTKKDLMLAKGITQSQENFSKNFYIAELDNLLRERVLKDEDNNFVLLKSLLEKENLDYIATISEIYKKSGFIPSLDYYNKLVSAIPEIEINLRKDFYFKEISLNALEEILFTKKYNSFFIAYFIDKYGIKVVLEENLQSLKSGTYITKNDDLSVIDSLTLFFQLAKRHKVLPAEIQRVIHKQFLKGNNDAKEILILTNLFLVVSIAKKYQDMGIPLLDIIQEGTIGLMEAINRYDSSFDTNLSTYGKFWIKKQILRDLFIPLSNFKVSTGGFILANKLKNVIKKMTLELKRTPTTIEIANRMDISVKKIMNLQYILSLRTISLEEQITYENDGEKGNSISEYIPDDNSFENSFIENDLSFLNFLTDRQKEVLIYLLGLAGNNPMNEVQVAEILGTTKQNVSSIYKKALSNAKKYYNQEEGIFEKQSTPIEKKRNKVLEYIDSLVKEIYKSKELSDLQNIIDSLLPYYKELWNKYLAKEYLTVNEIETLEKSIIPEIKSKIPQEYITRSRRRINFGQAS